MVTVYVVRHCEAMGNSQRIFQGHIDLDITKTGERQLECLKNRFNDITLDGVYSSPLIRAYKTAEAIVGERDLEIVRCDGLIELSGGVFEGMSFNKIFTEYAALEEVWQNKPQDFMAPEGEPMRALYDRIWATVLDIAKNNSGKTVAIASHGGAVRALLCRIIYNDIEHLSDTGWSENTGVSKIVFSDDLVPKIEFLNNIDHLPADLLPMRSRMDSMMEVEK